MIDPEKQKALDCKAIFDSEFEPGRRFLKHLSKFCRENSTCFVPESARETDLLQGRRDVIIEIRRLLNIKVDEQKPEIKEKEIV